MIQVMVLEGQQDNLIEIPDSPAVILISLPAGQLLVPIDEEVVEDSEDKKNFAIIEDQARQLEGEEVRELGVEGELYVDGENIHGGGNLRVIQFLSTLHLLSMNR